MNDNLDDNITDNSVNINNRKRFTFLLTLNLSVRYFKRSNGDSVHEIYFIVQTHFNKTENCLIHLNRNLKYVVSEPN